MQQTQWNPEPARIFDAGPLIPVLVIHEPDHALPVAEALLEGGIHTLEITLRTPAALEVISRIAARLPEALVGAGTVLDTAMLKRATEAGARFHISPGVTPELLNTAARGPVPLIPGVATVSELMTGLDRGYREFKFFPAEAAGGPAALKAFAGPFPDIRFCPTGGIKPDNMRDYLSLNNVACVGGSWLVTPAIQEQRDWAEITRLARAALAAIGPEGGGD